MKFPHEIEKRIRQNGQSDAVGNIMFTLMRHLNQSYSDIIKMPIPLVIATLKRLEKEMKEQEKAMKRKKR